MDERRNSTCDVRVRAVKAVLRGRSMSDVADAYDTNRSTISRWVKRYEEEGEEGLDRRPTSGRPRMLAQLTEEELRNVVLQPASQFGYETDLWTVSRLHVVIEEQYRVSVSKDTIWRRLREAGLTWPVKKLLLGRVGVYPCFVPCGGNLSPGGVWPGGFGGGAGRATGLGA